MLSDANTINDRIAIYINIKIIFFSYAVGCWCLKYDVNSAEIILPQSKARKTIVRKKDQDSDRQ